MTGSDMTKNAAIQVLSQAQDKNLPTDFLLAASVMALVYALLYIGDCLKEKQWGK